jgi:hypothetical protein
MAPALIDETAATEGPNKVPSKDLGEYACKVYGWPRQNARGYRIREEPFGALRPLRIIHIGAGASGITFSKFAEDKLKNVEVQLYEKNADIGGTWLENR